MMMGVYFTCNRDTVSSVSCQSHNFGPPHKCTPGHNHDDVVEDDADDEDDLDDDKKYDDLNLFVLDSPLEESFAGLTCEEAVVVAGHLQQKIISGNAMQSESE